MCKQAHMCACLCACNALIFCYLTPVTIKYKVITAGYKIIQLLALLLHFSAVTRGKIKYDSKNIEKEIDMIREENIYKLLGVSEQASPVMIKKSFRLFAKQHHPDFFPDDRLKEEKFKEVCSAYNSWRIFQNTIEEIKRLKVRSNCGNASGFEPWNFCHAV